MLDNVVIGEVVGHGPWSAAIEQHARSQVVRVMGELDIAEATLFESTIKQQIVDNRVFIVDLRDCSYVDSTIISVFIRLRRRLGEMLRVVARPGSAVERLFRVTNLYHQLNIIADLDGE